MTKYWRNGHWRKSKLGNKHWVEGHSVERDDWDRGDGGNDDAICITPFDFVHDEEIELPKEKLSKEEILVLISKLKKDPNAKYRILADLGIAGAGAAGAGAVAAVAGAGVVPIGWGLTTLTGFGIAVAAPVGLVAGVAVAGAVATYGITQAVRYEARQQGKREQVLQQLDKMLCDMSYDGTKAQTTEADKTKFILFLEEPVKLVLIASNDASDLIQLVQNGQISLFEAYRLVKYIIQEFDLEKGGNPDNYLPRLLEGS